MSLREDLDGGMTKKGFKEKFIKTFICLSLTLYALFLFGSGNFNTEEIIGQYIYAAMYVAIPAAIFALVWDFFSR